MSKDPNGFPTPEQMNSAMYWGEIIGYDPLSETDVPKILRDTKLLARMEIIGDDGEREMIYPRWQFTDTEEPVEQHRMVGYAWGVLRSIDGSWGYDESLTMSHFGELMNSGMTLRQVVLSEDLSDNEKRQIVDDYAEALQYQP